MMLGASSIAFFFNGAIGWLDCAPSLKSYYTDHIILSFLFEKYHKLPLAINKNGDIKIFLNDKILYIGILDEIFTRTKRR